MDNEGTNETTISVIARRMRSRRIDLPFCPRRVLRQNISFDLHPPLQQTKKQ